MAGIGTRDSGEAPQRAARFKTGHISLNTCGGGGLAAPCGGCKKSGVGRDKGLEALEHSTQVKHVCVPLDTSMARLCVGLGATGHGVVMRRSDVTESPAFQQWTTHMSAFLAQSPKREVYLIVEPPSP